MKLQATTGVMKPLDEVDEWLSRVDTDTPSFNMALEKFPDLPVSNNLIYRADFYIHAATLSSERSQPVKAVRTENKTRAELKAELKAATKR